ncbi:DUF881 domain-containing protein [Cutibacterium granulosum]|uniref:DUF881 domain-containing protein n=1 Tax=Cutibacterium granulosum TaxID=33011 RepID=UPI00396A6FEB
MADDHDEHPGTERPASRSSRPETVASSSRAVPRPGRNVDEDPDGSSPHTKRRRRGASILVVCLAGFMMTTAAINSRGQDLRPDTNSSMTDIVRKQAQRNSDLQTEANGLRSEVEKLSREKQGAPSADPTASAVAAPAGLQPVKGPAIEVVLSDAPLSVEADGVDANMLVVHQQDIQAVVNALWSGGAEAMTIQGQRVTAMTAVKCVGNTVVLHGVPYAPPYHIQAIGDLESLHQALDESESVRIYQQYVDAYQLGWKVRDKPSVIMPPFAGQATTGVVTPQPTR